MTVCKCDIETIFSKKTNIVSPGRLEFLPLISQLQSDTNQKEGFSASFFNTEAKTELSSSLLAQLAWKNGSKGKK